MVSMVDSMPRIISSGDVLDGVFEAGSVAVNAQCDFALFVNRSPYSDSFGELFLVDFSAMSLNSLTGSTRSRISAKLFTWRSMICLSHRALNRRL